MPYKVHASNPRWWLYWQLHTVGSGFSFWLYKMSDRGAKCRACNIHKHRIVCVICWSPLEMLHKRHSWHLAQFMHLSICCLYLSSVPIIILSFWPFVTGSGKMEWDHVDGTCLLSCCCTHHFQCSLPFSEFACFCSLWVRLFFNHSVYFMAPKSVLLKIVSCFQVLIYF